MSPRAAWRLEALGYSPVYDYVVGKSDWLAAGLPTEGERPMPPRVADVMDRSVPTCELGERVCDVVARLVSTSWVVCIVVTDGGVVQGRLRRDRVDASDERTAEEVMELGPATVRADADLAATEARMKDRSVNTLIVSTPDGVLLGIVHVEER